MSRSIQALMDRAPRTTHVYGDECGSLKSAPYFLLGIIHTRDPDRHEQQIHRFRSQVGYGRELKYNTTDRNQIPLTEKVISYVVNESDLRFRAQVIDNSQYDLSHYEGFEDDRRPEDISYNYRYRRLIERQTPRDDELVVILDDRRRADKDNLPSYLRDQLDGIKSLKLVDSKKYQLVQATDLVLGSIWGDATETSHPVKRTGVTKLREELGVDHLLADELGHRDEFRVDVWQPPRSQREEG